MHVEETCREECDFLHVTLAMSDKAVINTHKNELEEYKCVGCESSWTAKGYTVEYVEYCYFQYYYRYYHGYCC